MYTTFLRSKDSKMPTQPMLKFVKFDRDMPAKRIADERKKDFQEIYSEFAKEKAEEQSSRCSQCGVPFCQSHCPLHNNIPDWLHLTATGRLRKLMKSLNKRILFQKFAEGYVRRIAYVRVIVSLNNQGMAQSLSVP